MKARQLFVAVLATLMVVVGFSLVVVSASTPSGLRSAQSASFDVLRPTYLPAGAILIAEHVTPNPDGTTDVDLHYKLANGGRLHVWQTDRAATSLGEKNPLVNGSRVEGQLATWMAAPGFSGRVLTLNAQIGTLVVSIDGPLTTTALLEVADSLR